MCDFVSETRHGGDDDFMLKLHFSGSCLLAYHLELYTELHPPPPFETRRDLSDAEHSAIKQVRTARHGAQRRTGQGWFEADQTMARE